MISYAKELLRARRTETCQVKGTRRQTFVAGVVKSAFRGTSACGSWAANILSQKFA